MYDHNRRTSTTSKDPPEKSKNVCLFDDAIAHAGVYTTPSTDLSTRIKGRVQTSSMNFRSKSIELVTRGVVKRLKPRRIRLTTDSKLNRVVERCPSSNLSPIDKCHCTFLPVPQQKFTDLNVSQNETRILSPTHQRGQLIPASRRESSLLIVYVPGYEPSYPPLRLKETICHINCVVR